jgi:hypothetical protein
MLAVRMSLVTAFLNTVNSKHSLRKQMLRHVVHKRPHLGR